MDESLDKFLKEVVEGDRLASPEVLWAMPENWTDTYRRVAAGVFPGFLPDKPPRCYTPLTQHLFHEVVMQFCNLQFDIRQHDYPPTDVMKGIFATGVVLGIMAEREGWPLSMPDPQYVKMGSGPGEASDAGQ